MPIYEYKCSKCGKFETFQQITDEKLKKCPKCDSKVKRLISNKIVSDIKYNAREHYHKVIKPEAKEIAQKIKDGDENAAADIFGEKKMYKNE